MQLKPHSIDIGKNNYGEIALDYILFPVGYENVNLTIIQ